MRNLVLKKIWIFVCLACWVFSFMLWGQSSESSQRIERLKYQIEAITRGVEGEFGVAAKHIETGEEIFINGDTYFPMASVFKVPIFVEVMAQINEGRFTLEEKSQYRRPTCTWGVDI